MSFSFLSMDAIKLKDSKGYSTSICSLEKIKLHGMEQNVHITGKNKDNPLLLFLHPGPGTAQMNFTRSFQSKLEEYFIVVNWDQKNAANTFSNIISEESVNFDQLISDTKELVQILKKRFNKEKVFLVGHSWGSLLGILTIHRHPELFHAYIGVGQGTDLQKGEQISYQYTLDTANEMDNTQALKELEKIGYPPYNDNGEDILIQRKWLINFGGLFKDSTVKKAYMKEMLSCPEYTLFDKLKLWSGISFSSRKILGELNETSLFEHVPEVKVPVYFFAGRYDYTTPFELVQQYCEKLEAPRKELVWFGKSAHCPHLEESARFTDILISISRVERYYKL